MQWLPLPVLVLHGLLGGMAVFMHTAFAVLLDGHRERLRLMPLQPLGFLASLPVMGSALVQALRDQAVRRDVVWAKTRRYAQEARP